MLFASGGRSIEERCKIASEVVDAFTRIPVAYLRAISSPLLHHLAGIGAILGSIFEEPISEMAYEQVRVVLLALAQLLENLDHGIHSAISAQRLRNLVEQIDSYMKNQRDQQNAFPAHTGSQSNLSGTGQAEAADFGSDIPSNIPWQLATEFFEEWPWSFDFVQPVESWTSASMPINISP